MLVRLSLIPRAVHCCVFYFTTLYSVLCIERSEGVCLSPLTSTKEVANCLSSTEIGLELRGRSDFITCDLSTLFFAEQDKGSGTIREVQDLKKNFKKENRHCPAEKECYIEFNLSKISWPLKRFYFEFTWLHFHPKNNRSSRKKIWLLNCYDQISVDVGRTECWVLSVKERGINLISKPID